MTDDIIRKTFAGCLVLEKIGQGGMGIVYKAHHIKLNKVVCIKILPKELEADQRNIEFFLREAEISKQLDHPNTVHVYDFGKEKDKYYIIMSFVEGKSLETIVKEKGSLNIKEASDIMLGIMKGLEHAHSKNIIHRDIKPSNIIITKEGIPRIIDFGLARRIVEEKQLTITGEMIGTAYFMSPEQGLGNKVDLRSDLYSSGATYFYMLTGRYPFEGNSAIEVINQHIHSAIPNLYMIKPDLPIWAIRMIEKLMKKNPAERYQTATEVIKELEEYKKYDYKNIIISDKTREIIIDGIEEKEEQDKPQNQTYQNKPKKLENSQQNIEENPQQAVVKFQNTKLFILKQIFFHIFFTFFTIANVILYGYFKKNFELISYLLLAISILLIFHTAKKGTKLSSYIFSYLLLFIGIDEFVKNIEFNSFLHYLYLITKNSDFQINYFIPIASLSVLYIQNISPSVNSKKLKISLYVLMLILIVLSIQSFQSIFNIAILNIYKILLAIFLIIIFIFFIKYNKNLFLITYLITLSITLIYIIKSYIENNVEIIYEKELINYQKKIKEIEIKTKEELYFKLSEENFSSWDTAEKKIKEEIKNRISKIEPPQKDKIKTELINNFYYTLKKELLNSIRITIFYISFFIFIMLNIKYLITGLKTKNEI